MKCLRCGWKMDAEDIRCPHCNHYYQNNLTNRLKYTISYYDPKKYEKKLNLIIIVVLFIIPIILLYIEFKKVPEPKVEYNEYEVNYCNIKCENGLNRIEYSKCICSDGNEYSIE